MIGALIGKMIVGAVGEAIVKKVTGRTVVHPNDNKGLIQSKTVWGVGVASLGGWVFSLVSGWIGIDVSHLQAIVETLTVTAGSLLAIYGRIKAEKVIG